MNQKSLIKELQALQALFAEGVERTSRLEKGLVPVQEPAPRKGSKKISSGERALRRRNEFLARKAGK